VIARELGVLEMQARVHVLTTSGEDPTSTDASAKMIAERLRSG
jgi:hypothetical protein